MTSGHCMRENYYIVHFHARHIKADTRAVPRAVKTMLVLIIVTGVINYEKKTLFNLHYYFFSYTGECLESTLAECRRH